MTSRIDAADRQVADIRSKTKRLVAVRSEVCMFDRPPMSIDSDDLPACVTCAKCCHLLVELTPFVDRVPDDLVVEHEGVRCMDQRGDGACVALDPLTRLCTIYDQRPQVCRDFNRGDSLCRRAVLGRRGSLAPLPEPSLT